MTRAAGKLRHHPWIMAYQHLGAESAQDTGEYTRLDGTIDHGLRIHTGGCTAAFSNTRAGNKRNTWDLFQMDRRPDRRLRSAIRNQHKRSEPRQESFETPEQNDGPHSGNSWPGFADKRQRRRRPEFEDHSSAQPEHHNMTKIMPAIYQRPSRDPGRMAPANSPEGLRKMIAQAKAAGWWTPRIVRIDGDSQDPQALGHYSGWSTGPTVGQEREMNLILVSEDIPRLQLFRQLRGK